MTKENEKMKINSYLFKNVQFPNLLKALVRKYTLDEYKNKDTVIEISRKLINEDTLEIFRVHNHRIIWSNICALEKIIIDRKNKVYMSTINTKLYKEFCNYSMIGENIDYLQKYYIFGSFLFKESDRTLAFKNGCEIVEKLIANFDKN